MDLHLVLACAALAVACGTSIYVVVSYRRVVRDIKAMQELLAVLNEPVLPTAPSESWRRDVL